MNTIKKALGMEPIKEKGEIYTPSKAALKTAVKTKTDYDYTFFKDSYKGKTKKILIIGTEKDHLIMENGKIFLTGNHPVELFVPMLHLKKAGFEFDFATPTGKSMKLEHWAMPTEDVAVMEIYNQYKKHIENPLKLSDVADNIENNDEYIAVFIPGGHGAVMDLPENLSVKKIIDWTAQSDKHVISICHGPAAFIAAGIDKSKENFPYKGYKMVAFPDGMDKLLPAMGYLPGKMPIYFGEKLEELGMEITNKIATGKTMQDRKLLTGDSPMAANTLGKMAATELLKLVNTKQ